MLTSRLLASSKIPGLASIVLLSGNFIDGFTDKILFMQPVSPPQLASPAYALSHCALDIRDIKALALYTSSSLIARAFSSVVCATIRGIAIVVIAKITMVKISSIRVKPFFILHPFFKILKLRKRKLTLRYRR